MDTGAIAGKGEAIMRDKPIFQGRKNGGKAENLLEPFLKMEREFRVVQSVSSQFVRNTGMFIWKFLSFAGLIRRLCVFILWEKIFPAGLLGSFGLSPKPVYQVKIRAQGREGVWRRASQDSKQTVSLQFQDPGSQAGKAKHDHKDNRAYDLDLVFSGSADRGIESGKVIHYWIKVQHGEFFPDRAEFKM